MSNTRTKSKPLCTKKSVSRPKSGNPLPKISLRHSPNLPRILQRISALGYLRISDPLPPPSLGLTECSHGECLHYQTNKHTKSLKRWRRNYILDIRTNNDLTNILCSLLGGRGRNYILDIHTFCGLTQMKIIYFKLLFLRVLFFDVITYNL